ncbi:MAG: DUF1698 domain-containing protein [Actinobacteria bacterium]|nr:DUF1698 domain-containing protein [Actinomycetota bacterium]
MTVTIPFNEIYVRLQNNYVKLLDYTLFRSMVATWLKLEVRPDTRLTETPYYREMIRIMREDRSEWLYDEANLGACVAKRFHLYEEIRDHGYNLKETGEYPVLAIYEGKHTLIDGLNRLSILKALGISEATFTVTKNEYAYHTPYVGDPNDTGMLKRLVEKAHSHQLLYNPMRIVDVPMNLYLPINHPLYADAVNSRFDSPLRLQLILKEIGDPTNKRFLDVGSNSGWFDIELVLRKACSVGVEPLQEYVDIANFVAAYHRLDWKDMNLRRRIWFYPMKVEDYLAETEEKFDYVLFMGLFHHMLKENLTAAWDSLKKLSMRAPVMFFETGLSGEAQMKGFPSLGKETVVEEVLSHSQYKEGIMLSDGLLRDWKNRHVRPDLPLRPMYRFWR